MAEFIPDGGAEFTPDADAPKKAAGPNPRPFGLPAVPNPVDVILNPQGIPQHLLSLGATAALTGGAGSLAKQGAMKLGLPEMAVKAAPAIGRVIASGGMGAAEAFNRGEGLTQASRAASIDTIIAGITEGLFGAAGRLSKAEREVVKANRRGAEQAATAEARAREQTSASVARAQEAQRREAIKAETKNAEQQKIFEWAKEQPEKAIAAISPSVDPYAFLHVPTLSRTPLNLGEIAEKIKALRGEDYAQARKEVVAELNRLSGTGVRKDLPAAGTSFERRTSPRLFEPEAVAPRPSAVQPRAARPVSAFTPEPMPKTLRGYVTRENMPRAAADALMTQPGPGNFPLGLVGGAFAPDYLGDLARRALQSLVH